MKRRPILPLASWSIATHLSATRKVQQDSSYPTHQCYCDCCEAWKKSGMDWLPAPLRQQFARIGLEEPIDVYRQGKDSLRAVYAMVGHVLTGPAPWLQDQNLGEIRNYHSVQTDPDLQVVVYRDEKGFYPPPSSYQSEDGHYLLVDLLVSVSND